jgi:hypothetical protein
MADKASMGSVSAASAPARKVRHMNSTFRTHRWLAGSGLALLVLTGLGCDAENTAHPPMDDVDPAWSCRADAHGVLRARGSVTNQSSKPSLYLVTVDFAIGGRAFDFVTERIDDVDPGETVEVEASVFDAPDGEPDCIVSDVERFEA